MAFRVVGKIWKENPDSLSFVMAVIEGDLPLPEYPKKEKQNFPPLEILEREGAPSRVTKAIAALKQVAPSETEVNEAVTEIARALLGEKCVPYSGKNLPQIQPWSGYIRDFNPEETYLILDVAWQKVIGKIGKKTDVSQLEMGKIYLAALEDNYGSS